MCALIRSIFKTYVLVFCVLMLCSVAVGYRRVGGPSWLHLQAASQKTMTLIYIAVKISNLAFSKCLHPLMYLKRRD